MGQLFWGPQTRTLTAVAQEVDAGALAVNTQNAVRPGLTGARVGKQALSGFHVQVRERLACDRPHGDATRPFKGRSLIENDGLMDRVRSCCCQDVWPGVRTQLRGGSGLRVRLCWPL